MLVFGKCQCLVSVFGKCQCLVSVSISYVYVFGKGSSRLPELPDSDCRDRFRRIGRTCVLDLCFRETNSCVQPLGSGCVFVDCSPFVPYCRVEEKLSHPIVERLDCDNLDTLSLGDTEESVIPRDFSVTLLCGSDDGHTPVGSDQVLSDVDLPSGSRSEDWRQVLRTQNLSPEGWSSRRSVSMCRPADGSDGQMPHSAGVQDTVPVVWPKSDEPELLGASPSPLVGQVDTPVVEPVEPVQLSSPPLSGKLSPVPGDDRF